MGGSRGVLGDTKRPEGCLRGPKGAEGVSWGLTGSPRDPKRQKSMGGIKIKSLEGSYGGHMG